MNSPVPETITKRLLGSEVELISFGKYVIHVRFDTGDMLSIACPFAFDKAPLHPNTPVHEFPLEQSNLIRAIGYSVLRLRSDEDGTLEIHFSNGDALVAYANDPMYEAYTLVIDGTEYTV